VIVTHEALHIGIPETILSFSCNESSFIETDMHDNSKSWNAMVYTKEYCMLDSSTCDLTTEMQECDGV